MPIWRTEARKVGCHRPDLDQVQHAVTDCVAGRLGRKIGEGWGIFFFLDRDKKQAKSALSDGLDGWLAGSGEKELGWQHICCTFWETALHGDEAHL